MKTGICIPSAGRHNRQDTIDNLPEQWLKRTRLIVPLNEYREYKSNYGDKVEVIKCPVNGISKTRQWIMENINFGYIIMASDDLYFSTRKDGRLVKSTPEDVDEMFLLLEQWLDEGLVHVGISQRAGNNTVLEDYVEIVRMNDLYAYNKEEFLRSGVRFDRLQVMEDFDVTLSLLRKGFKNRVSYKYAWGQRKSGDKGGCSTYRTSEVQHESACQLARLHSGFVSITEKESKTEWENIGNCRTDVIISWQAAYGSFLSKTRKPSKGLFK